MQNLIEINSLDTAGIYRIKYANKNSDKGYYIGVTKQKLMKK